MVGGGRATGRGTLPTMKPIAGVITAMATPFDDRGEVDADAARRLAVRLLEHGAHGLVVAGTTGECPTLTDEEEIALLRAVRAEVGDDVLLVCGTGTNDTRHSCELTKMAAEAGADASLVVAPYYNKPNRAGLRAHFETVAAAVPELPLIMYNIPSRVVVNMPPDLLAELAGVENIVAVKQANDEELGPIDGLAVLAGNDNTFLRALQFGGAGGITVASHVAGEQMRAMWDAAREGDLDRAGEIDADLQPLYEGLSVTTNPIPLKAALEMLGLVSERMRLPLVPCDAEQRATVRAALEGIGLAVAR
jgi:4-hydroxy-tetrahydrodipicolinate synthase